MWHKIKKSPFRIFGLDKSIHSGEVYVFCSRQCLVGFVRFNISSNKTNDFLRINEIYLNDALVKDESHLFYRFIDEIILRLGYISAKFTTSIEDYDLLKDDWEIDSIKTQFSSGDSFLKFVLSREIKIKSELCLIKYFGVYL